MPLQITAFVHGHEKSWHSNIPEDLSNLNWDAVGSYLPLSRKYFHNYGPFFWLYPGDPRRHLEIPVARGAEALNGSYSQHEGARRGRPPRRPPPPPHTHPPLNA